MPERARVTSLEAIETFRAVLVVYREKAARVLDEAADNVVQTRLWLQTNRMEHWKNEVRHRGFELKQRQQELFSARLSTLSNSSFVQQAAVQKAEEALREAEARLQTVKQWNRQFDQRVEPLAKQVEKFRHDIGQDLGKAVVWLAELNKTLSAYAELSPASGDGSPSPTSAPAEEDVKP
jgi:RNase H-fold protein (predicted Holliday junction resolvase)